MTCFARAVTAACAAWAFGLGGAELGFDPVREPERAADIYVAPLNSVIWRMHLPDGQYRAFERILASPADFRGRDGWTGRRKGDSFVIRSPRNEPGGPFRFDFKGGHLVRFVRPGATNEVGTAQARPKLPMEASPLFSYMVNRQVDPDSIGMSVAGKWAKSGRLGFPYENPNQSGALYALLALIPLAFVASRRRAIKICAVSFAVIFAGLVLATGSRGALLGLFCGLLPVLLFRFRGLLRSRRFWLVCGIGLVVCGTAICAFRPRMLTRGFGEGRKGWSNRIRTELWSAAPRMMEDAPGGWAFCGAGPAYVDWYQPYDKVCFTGTLMNDHLNRLVEYGWFGRWAYLLCAFLFLGLFALCAIRTGEAVPLGAVIAFGVASWFNPVSRDVDLWLVLAVACVPAVWRWRMWFRLVPVAVVMFLAAVLPGLVLGGIHLVAEGQDPSRPPIHVEDGRVTLAGCRPQTWVVDDGLALGGILFGKDLRAMYGANSWLPSVGYVRKVSDIPSNARRLVLAGGAGDEWLRLISSDEKMREHLPKDVLFVSPPFPPQAIPSPLFQRCRIRILIGEFALRYTSDYDGDLPDWVTIVPGAELYIPLWLGYAFR